MLGNVAPSYKDFQLLLEEQEFAALIKPSVSVKTLGEETAEEAEDLDPTELAQATTAETDEDAVTELVDSSSSSQRSSIPELWRSMVDIEASLANEARAVGPSSLRRDNGVHAVPIELMRGHFEFDKRDRVNVERLGNDGRWRRIGILDLARSSAEFIHIEASANSVPLSSIDWASGLQFLLRSSSPAWTVNIGCTRRVIPADTERPPYMGVYRWSTCFTSASSLARMGKSPRLLLILMGLHQTERC